MFLITLDAPVTIFVTMQVATIYRLQCLSLIGKTEPNAITGKCTLKEWNRNGYDKCFLPMTSDPSYDDVM